MRSRARSFWLLLLAAALLLAPAASAVTMDWVYIGDPGNAADTAWQCVGANCGSVSYSYFISKHEVTNAQYAEFLNSKAAGDPLDLYETRMGSDATFGGITRSGVSGNFTYTAKDGFANKPVNYVTFYDTLRFSNWLNNGQGSGDTETGAYTLLGGTPLPTNWNTVPRNGGANIFLTSENEWYKAAYYDALSMSYFDYPSDRSTEPDCVAPGSDTGNSANCAGSGLVLTDVGAYSLSYSPYGTYDQGGNVWERNEQIVSGLYPAMRGGSLIQDASYVAASGFLGGTGSSYSDPYIGFRVASPIPEPSTGLLVMTGLLGLAYRQRPARNSVRRVATEDCAADLDYRALHDGRWARPMNGEHR